MPNTRPKKHHLWNFDAGKTICGKDADRFGAQVTSDSCDVTCEMCRGELTRWTRQVAELAEKTGGNVFLGMLEDAGISTKAGSALRTPQDPEHSGRCINCGALIIAKTADEWAKKVQAPCPKCGKT